MNSLEILSYKEFEIRPDLFDAAGTTSEEVKEDKSAFFYDDCDYVKANGSGELGRGDFKFFTIGEPTKPGVIYVFEKKPTKKVIKIIEWFNSPNAETDDDVQTWEDWKWVNQGVAYRGNRGHVYSLFPYSKIKKQ